jgi:hypothetical protein
MLVACMSDRVAGAQAPKALVALMQSLLVTLAETEHVTTRCGQKDMSTLAIQLLGSFAWRDCWRGCSKRMRWKRNFKLQHQVVACDCCCKVGEGLSVQSGNSQSRDTEDNPCWGRRITHHTPSLAARSDGNVSLGCYHPVQVLAHAPAQGAGV